METLRRMLVPVDGSPGSRLALEEALRLAEAVDAEVTILQVVEEFGPLPGKYEAAPPGEDRVAWLSNKRLDEVQDLLANTAAPWRRQVVEGYAPESICLAAEGHDLIVMGSRGLSGVQRFLLGSVSDRVAHHAPCSVWIVKPKGTAHD